MKAFIYNQKLYLRVIPSKFMMRSTMIYEMTVRGDILAMEVESQEMTVTKGTESVVHVEYDLVDRQDIQAAVRELIGVQTE